MKTLALLLMFLLPVKETPFVVAIDGGATIILKFEAGAYGFCFHYKDTQNDSAPISRCFQVSEVQVGTEPLEGYSDNWGDIPVNGHNWDVRGSVFYPTKGNKGLQEIPSSNSVQVLHARRSAV